MSDTPYDLTANLNVQLNMASLTKALNIVSTALRTLPREYVLNCRVNQGGLTELKAALGNLPQGLNQASTAAMSHTVAQERLRRSVGYTTEGFWSQARAGAINARTLSTWTGQIITLATAYRTLRASVHSYLALEKSQTGFAQVTAQPLAEVKATIGSRVRRSAQQYGVGAGDLMKLSTTLAQADFKQSEVEGLIDTLSKLKLNTQIESVDSLANSIIVLKSAFKHTTPEIEASLSSMIGVSKAYAVEMKDLQAILGRTAGTMVNAGGNIHTVNALGTALRQNTRLQPEEIGTFLKSQTARVVGGGIPTKTIENTLGVRVFDDKGKQRDLMAIYTDVASALSKLNDEERNNIALKISGMRQSSLFLALMQNMSFANEVYTKSLHSTNEIEKDAMIAQQALGNRIEKLHQQWSNLTASLIESKGFDTLSDQTFRLTANLMGLASNLNAVLPLLATVGAVRFGESVWGRGRLPGGSLPPSSLGFGSPTSFERGISRGLVGYGGRFVQRAGPALPIGLALGGELLAANNEGSPVAQGVGHGVAVGATLSTFMNPWVAALAGGVTAVTSFSDTLENVTRKRLSTVGDENLERYRVANDKFSSTAIADLRKAMRAQVEEGIIGAAQEPSWYETAWHGITHPFSEKGAAASIADERLNAVRSAAKSKYEGVVTSEANRVAS